MKQLQQSHVGIAMATGSVGKKHEEENSTQSLCNLIGRKLALLLTHSVASTNLAIPLCPWSSLSQLQLLQVPPAWDSSSVPRAECLEPLTQQQSPLCHEWRARLRHTSIQESSAHELGGERTGLRSQAAVTWSMHSSQALQVTASASCFPEAP